MDQILLNIQCPPVRGIISNCFPRLQWNKSFYIEPLCDLLFICIYFDNNVSHLYHFMFYKHTDP